MHSRAADVSFPSPVQRADICLLYIDKCLSHYDGNLSWWTPLPTGSWVPCMLHSPGIVVGTTQWHQAVAFHLPLLIPPGASFEAPGVSFGAQINSGSFADSTRAVLCCLMGVLLIVAPRQSQDHMCLQGVGMQDVLRELRSRFAVSGLDEKASRVSKQA